MKKKVLFIIAVLLTGISMAQQHPNFTQEGAQNYLNNKCYEVLKWQFPWGMSTSVTLNMLSDDNYAKSSAPDDESEFQMYDTYEFNTSNKAVSNLWDKYCEGINRCNRLITYTTSGTPEANRTIAEAKFLRALYYFDFVRFFGNIPLVINANLSFNNPPAQASKEEVYTQIENDLLAAIAVLPQKSALTTGEADRATQGAARSLLAKVYLYEEKWSESIDQLDIVIASGQYALLSNFADLWVPTNKHNAESIFEIPFVDTTMDWNTHNMSNMDIQFMGAWFNGSSPDCKYLTGWGFCNVTENLLTAFQTQNDSVRLYASIYSKDSIENYGMDVQYDVSGFYINKYAPKREYTPANNYGWSQNEMVLRYADVLLMYAEAKYKLGDEVNARAKLNQVRARALLPDVNATGVSLFTAIQNERRLELAFENNRFFDLVRWEQANTVLGPLGYNSYNNILPIPNKALHANENLINNVGYDDPTPISQNYIVNAYSSLFYLYKNNLDSVIRYRYNSANTDSLKEAKYVFIKTGNVLNINTYGWDIELKKWVETSREIDTLTNEGKLASFTTSSKNFSTNSWNNTVYENYTYNDKGYQTSFSHFGWHTTNWELIYKIARYPDAYGNDTLSVDVRPQLYNRMVHTLNSNNKPIETVNYSKMGINAPWNINSKRIIKYDSHNNAIQYDNYYWFDSVFTFNRSDKYNLSYNSDNLIYQNIYQQCDTSLQFINVSKTNYILNDKKDIYTSTSMNWYQEYNDWWFGYNDENINKSYYYYTYTTNINDNNILHFKIWPNPVKTKAYISLNNIENTDATFILYSAEGRLVKTSKLSRQLNGIYELNMTNLPNGVYSLSIVSGNNTSSKKIILLK